jgi:hypothetical protein
MWELHLKGMYVPKDSILLGSLTKNYNFFAMAFTIIFHILFLQSFLFTYDVSTSFESN